MKQFIQFGRLSQAVRQAAAKHGLRGDPFAETPPFLATAGMELKARELWLDIPKAIRDIAPAAAQKMCRSIVHSHVSRMEAA
jgi:hypothetical protein